VVDVPEFAGPLDLLLGLIQKRRLDVTAVSLAAVADQYLEKVLALEGELDALSEFLMLASQLLLIKSRALLPASGGTEPEIDPAEDLRRRLAEYDILRAAASWLGERESAGWRSWARGGDLPPSDAPVTIAPVAPLVLARLLVDRLNQRPPASPTDSLPPNTRPTLRARARYLLDQTSVSDWRSLESLLGCGVPSAVATFLAVLVLVRAGLLFVRQPEAAGLPEVRRVAGAEVDHLEGLVWE
jgi:segregation and condensation protein A